MYYIFDNDKESIFNTAINYYMKSLENLSVDEVTIIVPRKGNAINSTSNFNNKIQDILLKNEKKIC